MKGKSLPVSVNLCTTIFVNNKFSNWETSQFSYPNMTDDNAYQLRVFLSSTSSLSCMVGSPFHDETKPIPDSQAWVSRAGSSAIVDRWPVRLEDTWHWGGCPQCVLWIGFPLRELLDAIATLCNSLLKIVNYNVEVSFIPNPLLSAVHQSHVRVNNMFVLARFSLFRLWPTSSITLMCRKSTSRR